MSRASNLICLGLSLLVSLSFAVEGSAPSAAPGTQKAVSSEGVLSPYTYKLIDLAKEWAARPRLVQPQLADAEPFAFLTKTSTANPLALHCYFTPKSKSYVGVRGTMDVNASLAKMEEIVTAFGNYQHLFPGYKDIHIEKHQGNEWMTAWEQIIPVFFLSNLHYNLRYIASHPQPNRTQFRIQLEKPGSLKKFDGLILLEAENSTTTHYVQYNFFDADYGILQTVAPGKIWSGAAEALYLSDLGFKFRAEHPDWEFEKIRDEAKKMLDRFPVDDVIATRTVFKE